MCYSSQGDPSHDHSLPSLCISEATDIPLCIATCSHQVIQNKTIPNLDYIAGGKMGNFMGAFKLPHAIMLHRAAESLC